MSHPALNSLNPTRRGDAFDAEVQRRDELQSADWALGAVRGLSAGRGGAGADAAVALLRSHDGRPSGDRAFAESAAARGLWPTCLALERADTDLAALLSVRPDRSVGARDWRLTRLLARQLASALAACHVAGFIHAAFQPSHCLRVGDSLGGLWKLADFQSAASFRTGEYLAGPMAPGYAPPEAWLRGDDGALTLRLVPERGVLEAWEPGSLRADPSFDMWSFGAVLWEIVFGEPLLLPDGQRCGGAPLSAVRELVESADSDLERRLDGLCRPVLGGQAADSGPDGPGAAGAGKARASLKAASALLQWLLRRDPRDRPASMAEARGSASLPGRFARASFCEYPVWPHARLMPDP